MNKGIITTTIPFVIFLGMVYAALLTYIEPTALILGTIGIAMFIFATIVGYTFYEEIRDNNPEITFDKIVIYIMSIAAGFIGIVCAYFNCGSSFNLVVILFELFAILAIAGGVYNRRRLNRRKR